MKSFNKKKYLVRSTPRSKVGEVIFWAVAHSKNELMEYFPNGYEFIEEHEFVEYWPDNKYLVFDVDDEPGSTFTALIASSHGKDDYWCFFEDCRTLKEVMVYAFSGDDIIEKFSNLYLPKLHLITTRKKPSHFMLENVDIDKPKPWMKLR